MYQGLQYLLQASLYLFLFARAGAGRLGITAFFFLLLRDEFPTFDYPRVLQRPTLLVHLQLLYLLDNLLATDNLQSECRCDEERKGFKQEPLLLTNFESNLTKHHVHSVQMRRGGGGDEELAAVDVGALVGHGQQEGLLVLHHEPLVLEHAVVDTLATLAVALGEVA